MRSDLDDIALIHVQAWHETYAGMLAQHVIEARTVERRREQTLRWLADPGVCAYVALVDDKVIGFATGGSLREPVTAFDGELRSIYLLQRGQRRGLGTMLVRAIARDLQDRGFVSMAVLVLAANVKARVFYQRLGARFVEIAPTVYVDGAAFNDAIYAWDDLTVLVRS